MPIDSLLQQVEQYRLQRELRDGRPDRLVRFISDVAELFEPMHGVGRVGFDCRAVDGGWAISMFLGATEVLGGRDDGLSQHAPYHFDIEAAVALFTHVATLRFTAQPMTAEVVECGLTISGHVDDYPVRLAIHAIPPEHVQPGLQRLPDRTLRLL